MLVKEKLSSSWMDLQWHSENSNLALILKIHLSLINLTQITLNKKPLSHFNIFLNMVHPHNIQRLPKAMWGPMRINKVGPFEETGHSIFEPW